MIFSEIKQAQTQIPNVNHKENFKIWKCINMI